MRKISLVLTAVLLVVLTVVGTREWERIQDAALIQGCVFTGESTNYELSPEQAGNAATIAGVAIRRDLPKRATTVALATALQESKLLALDYGDRDSVGLFQQRPSQGWGPRAMLLDPVYSTNKFFNSLTRNSDWQQLSIADAAQAVQRSAAGSAYQGWEEQARVMSETLISNPYGLTCHLHRYVTSSDSINARESALAHDLKKVFGSSTAVLPETRGVGVDVKDGESGQVAAWLVAHADQYGIAQIDTSGHSWSRREWQANSDNLSQIRVRFL